MRRDKHNESKWVLIALAAVTVMACGDEVPENPALDPNSRGFTACGDVTCQPGQYCADSMFSRCENGCTSDVNCALNQSCIEPDFFNVGHCANTGPVCGDGTCEAGESCPADCGTTPVCGNGVCEAGETTASCPGDCQSGPVCGNGVCEAGETPQNCADCISMVDACKDDCFSYDFFECFGPGDLQWCYDECNIASDTQITQFLNCGGAIFCDSSCFDYLP